MLRHPTFWAIYSGAQLMPLRAGGGGLGKMKGKLGFPVQIAPLKDGGC